MAESSVSRPEISLKFLFFIKALQKNSIDISIDFQVTLKSVDLSANMTVTDNSARDRRFHFMYLHMYTTPTCLTAHNEWMHNRKPK